MRYIYICVSLLSKLLICCDEPINHQNSNTFENIDLLVSIYNKPIISFQVDSSGKVLEINETENNIKVYHYNLNVNESDSLKSYVDKAYKFNDSFGKKDDCSHGVFYNLTISTERKEFEYENVVCYEKTIMDEMVLYILSVSENKLKEPLFKNYFKYREFINNVPR